MRTYSTNLNNEEGVDSELLLKQECYDVVGCCMAVHRELGIGFLESVYQEALSYELEEMKIPFEMEKMLSITYKGRKLKKKYYADFLCYDQLIIELKTVESLIPEHIAQVINYLKATGLKVALLINFGSSSLQFKRVIL